MTDASPQFVGSLVAGLAGLIGLGVLAKKYSGSPEPRSISPQPLEVKQTPKYTEADDCSTKHEEVDARIQAVEERANKNMQLIREELARVRRGNNYLQQRMDGMVEVVYAIGGRMGIVLPKLPNAPMEDMG